ncbi:hypothetical protein DDF62_08680 [Caulobacter radicis]|uniref:hypothetical protein n=1 Tax=Caulobacter radicis TaxID=2172650 RepID=UPI000D58793B|nr:hypothetical protein [Caulobacter radicis]PVM90871.1 hypothetical protein DDF62_08680 [Caulobacter radicis]
MSSLFAFRCATPDYPRPTSTLVIFAGPSGYDTNSVLTAITDETRSDLAPELVIILVPDTISDPTMVLTEDDGVLAALSPTTVAGLYKYDAKGAVMLEAALRGTPPKEPPLDALKRQGLTTLFVRRGGCVEAGPTEHFVKPSKRLDTRFLRASHALSDGAEIFFVAFWLLPALARSQARYVHIDSSSIASVVLAASLLRGGEVPVVRTFQSYGGIQGYQFNLDRQEVVLISASQSGTLAGEISDKVKDPSLIITLFSTADPATGTSTLCDLRFHDEENALGLPSTTRVPDPASSRPIRLIGEHFTAEPRPPRSIVPGRNDAPDVVVKYLARLQGHGVFHAYKASLRGEKRAVWIDVQKLIATDVFAEWMKEVVSRTIPVATKAIIQFGDDPGSKPHVDAILKEAQRQGAALDRADVLTLSDIEGEDAKADWPETASAVLVVGGVTGHGAELLAASRALRVYASRSHRLYLTAAAMPSSRRSAELLRSNLTLPTHKFQTMFELVLDRAKTVSSWRAEYEMLTDHDGLPEALASRFDILRKTGDGLESTLFLEGERGPLKLRENFAFWPGKDCSSASQADVFTTIAVILENLRGGETIAQERRLTNTIYDRSVLSAETFTRYNDGIIQAAILRAAHPIELNYEDAPEESRLVADLIEQMTELSTVPQGEALSEFLLALALGRLKLCRDDLLRLQTQLEMVNLSDMQDWLAQRVRALKP